MQVAVVGLGKMGTALAERLLGQGVGLTLWDRRPERTASLVRSGAVTVPGLPGVWERTGTAMTFLSDDNAVLQVCTAAHGLVPAAPPGAALIEMSTISPAASTQVARAAGARGVHYVRCPVSGNPDVLRSGNATLIASGPAAARGSVRALLELVGARLYEVGEADEARVIKLAVNAMLAANAQMLAELITLCEARNIDRSLLLDVLSGSAVGSPFVRYKTEALLAKQYNATFTTEMLVKDLGLVHSVASADGVPVPVTDLVADLAAAACAEGLGDLDFLALLPHLQARAGRPSDVPVITPSPLPDAGGPTSVA